MLSDFIWHICRIAVYDISHFSLNDIQYCFDVIFRKMIIYYL